MFFKMKITQSFVNVDSEAGQYTEEKSLFYLIREVNATAKLKRILV